jgi:hypothetical protein
MVSAWYVMYPHRLAAPQSVLAMWGIAADYSRLLYDGGFQTEEEAVALANDTPLGLAAYVYARDVGRIFGSWKR